MNTLSQRILVAVCFLAACDGSVADEQQPEANGSGGCPAEAPEHTLAIDCPTLGLTCAYTRDDGCPMVYRCGDPTQPEYVEWLWELAPDDGTSCNQPGQSCHYSEWECGGQPFTATCEPNGTWSVVGGEIEDCP